MYTVVAALVAAFAVALVVWSLLGRPLGAGSRAREPAGDGSRKNGPRGQSGTRPAGTASPHACPLCGSPLAPGERVKSDLSPGPGDRIMRIFGCPRCWPAGEGGPARVCPVCGGDIPPGGWAVARYFEKPGRKHVHVLGCTACRPKARSI